MVEPENTYIQVTVGRGPFFTFSLARAIRTPATRQYCE